MKVVVLVALILTAVAAEYTSYFGYKVYNIIPKNENEVKLLQAFNSKDGFDFWSEVYGVGISVSVMVAPNTQNLFTSFLVSNGVKYTILIDNVERTIIAERAKQAATPKVDKGRISFNEYHRYDVIQDYLNQLSEDYPDIVSLEVVGASTEGRNMTVIKIGTGGTDKPIILVDGGIHAREWIAPAQVLYIIQQLVDNPENRHMIESIDWYIIPVMNPDGYEYAHTVNRLWRKTRSEGTNCIGVDANRNFGFHWMETGSSSDECSEIYAGPNAFSEPEAVALKTVVEKYKNNIKLYLSFHSYGQLLLYPWGWTSALPENVDELTSLAGKAEAAIAAVNGTRYTIGSSANTLAFSAGSSRDWVAGVGEVALSYTIELPSGGSSGFELPVERINEVVSETWKGVEVYHTYIKEKFAANN